MKARALWIPGALGLFIGCNGGGGGSDCQPGNYLCQCLNDLCQVGLVCSNNVCLSPDDAETSDGPGDGDGDPGDGDPGDGDGDPGDGDPGDGDGDPSDGDPDDLDGDGIPNAEDNCPNDPNPNQLDFDENSIGNVCDILEFTPGQQGGLTTNVWLDAGNGETCLAPMDLWLDGGIVRVQLDDDAAVARFEIVELDFDNAGVNFGSDCDLGGVSVHFELWTPLISEDGDPFPIEVPHSLSDHDLGRIDGSSNGGQPMELTGDVFIFIDEQVSLAGHYIQLFGVLPEFSVFITGGGSDGDITFADPGLELTPLDQLVLTDPVPMMLEYRLVGLEGSVQLPP